MFNDEDDSIADGKDIDSFEADVWEIRNDPMYQLEHAYPDVEVQSTWNDEEDEDE